MNKIVIIMVSFILALTAVAAQEVDNNYYFPRHIKHTNNITIYDRADSSSECTILPNSTECITSLVIQNNDRDFNLPLGGVNFNRNFNTRNGQWMISNVTYIQEPVELVGYTECQYKKFTQDGNINCNEFIGYKTKEVFDWQPISPPPVYDFKKGTSLAIGYKYSVNKWEQGEYNFTVFIPHIGELSVGTTLSGCGTISTSDYYEMNTSVSSTTSCFTLTANHTEINCNNSQVTFATAGGSTFGISITGTNLINITIRNCIFNTTSTSSARAVNCALNCPYNLSVYNSSFYGAGSSNYFASMTGSSATQSVRPTHYYNNITIFSRGQVGSFSYIGFVPLIINNSYLRRTSSVTGRVVIDNTIYSIDGSFIAISDGSGYDTTNIEGGIYNSHIVNTTTATTAGWLSIANIDKIFKIQNTTINTTTPAMTTYGKGVFIYDMTNNFSFINNTINHNVATCYPYHVITIKTMLTANISGNKFYTWYGYNCTHVRFFYKMLSMQFLTSPTIADNLFYMNFTNNSMTNITSCMMVEDYASGNARYINNNFTNDNPNSCTPLKLYYTTGLQARNLIMNIPSTNQSIVAEIDSDQYIIDSPNINNTIFLVTNSGKIYYSWIHNTFVNQTYYGGPVPDASVSFYYEPESRYFGGGITDITGYTNAYYLPQFQTGLLGRINMSYIGKASSLAGSVIDNFYNITSNGTWYAQLGYDVGYVNSYESKCTPYLNAGETSLICTYKAKSPSDAPLLGATGRWNLTDSADNLISTGTIKEFMLGTYWFNMSINSSLAGAYKVSTKMSFTDSLFLDPILIMNNTRMCVYDTLVVRQI